MRGIITALVLLLGGCYEQNELYCEGLPDNDCRNLDGERCAADADCRDPSIPRCNTVSDVPVCVQCISDSDCSSDAPICSSDHRCSGCRADNECQSKTCLEDGRCASEAEVIYTKVEGSDVPGCGLRPGDNECSFTRAFNELTLSRHIIRLAPARYLTAGARIEVPATLVARGSTIERFNSGPIITVASSQSFKLVGGTLADARDDSAIQCDLQGALEIHEAIIENADGVGIVTDSCELTLSRSILRGNGDGGIKMIGAARTARITNNFVTRNGEPNVSDTGGMWLSLANDSVIEFNTVVDNGANFQAATAGGIKCEGAVLNLPRNIIYRNSGGPGGSQDTLLCTFNQSYVVHGVPSENTVGFVRPNDPTNPDYHLTAASPSVIRDVSECSAPSVDVDFDGQRRPAGDKCDYGADEFVP